MPLLLLLQGRNQNEAIVLDWAKTCCSEGGILERNFSVLGPEENSGPEIILKDSMRDYKLHASGRRNCLGLLAELDLLPRQDLFQRLYYQVRLSLPMERRFCLQQSTCLLCVAAWPVWPIWTCCCWAGLHQ